LVVSANCSLSAATMLDDEFESRILAFEQAWRDNGPREIADFVDRPPALTPIERRRLLLELVCVDLEFRWRNAGWPGSPERTTVEHYLAKLTELGPVDELPVDLIAEEYRVRSLWGDRPSHSEFVARFPAGQVRLHETLIEIDRELKAEENDSRERPRTKARPSRSLTIGPEIHGEPLLSHHDFALKRMIGSGAMGKVYLAWQHSEERAVALKFLRKSFLDQFPVVQRFLGEARTIAKLRHCHIVEAHGLGRTSAGAYFFVMELVAGPNLATVARSRPVSAAEAMGWSIQTCLALEHAHSHAIVHCDLKPANVLLDERATVRVTDFGFARSLTESTPWAGAVEGTAHFMAPEKASRFWGRIGVHTDVYGIGAVLYALLTGRPPWTGARLPDILADVVSGKRVTRPISLRPDVPRALSELCEKCLAKAPADRYRTVEELRLALTDLAGSF
jgi:tRNA A-37 threonylcarbamoyl transferase component Bud32